jgi:hypothetical protein
MIAFDTTFLTLMFVPGAKHEIANARERIEFLISDVNGAGERILIPTPAFSEILIKSGDARNAIINVLTKSSKFLIAAFDTRCALELSLMSDAAFTRSNKRGGAAGTWTKVKFDRQIVTIAKTFGARAIYSDDDAVRATAAREGLASFGVADIKIPDKIQGGLWSE